jgi:hypothetical protein
VFPVVIGSGKRLFADGAIPAGLKLVDSAVSTTGVVIGTYEPAGEVSSSRDRSDRADDVFAAGWLGTTTFGLEARLHARDEIPERASTPARVGRAGHRPSRDRGRRIRLACGNGG